MSERDAVIFSVFINWSTVILVILGVTEEYRQKIYRLIGDGNKGESNHGCLRGMQVSFSSCVVGPPSFLSESLLGGVTQEYRQSNIV